MDSAASSFDREQLRATTFVRHVEVHDTLDSTNSRAAELARHAQVKLPALVVAGRQTAGRGRGGKSWWSAEGALTFSLLIEPAAMGIGTSDWPRLSLTTAVAVCDALQAETTERGGRSEDLLSAPGSLLPAPCSIKWPNDVLLNGRKVCGILIESPGGGAPAKDRLIIGIGINVNNSWQNAPRDAGPRGISLCDFTAKQHDLQTVLVNCLQAIEDRCKQLAAGVPELSETWRQLDWLTDQAVEIHTNGRWIEGICLDIDHDGALIVENIFGQHRVYSGSVRVS